MHYGTISDTIELDVGSIEADGACQMRPALDEAKVDEYAGLMAEGADFPPLKVVRDEQGRDWLWDGFHTLAAARKLGWQTIPAEVEPGTRRDAIFRACGANAAHGLPRPPEAIRRAIYTLLADPEWRVMDQGRIADVVGCSRQTANRWCQKFNADVGHVPSVKPKGNGKPAKNSSAGANGVVSKGDSGDKSIAPGDADAGWEETGRPETDAERKAREYAELMARCEGVRSRLDERCRALFDANAAGYLAVSATVGLLRDQYRQHGGRKGAVGPFWRRVSWLVECPEPGAWLACLDCQDDESGLSTGRQGSQDCPACRGRGFHLGS